LPISAAGRARLQAFAQGIHQVDDIPRVARLGDMRDLVTLLFLLHERPQRFLVAAGEFRRNKSSRRRSRPEGIRRQAGGNSASPQDHEKGGAPKDVKPGTHTGAATGLGTITISLDLLALGIVLVCLSKAGAGGCDAHVRNFFSRGHDADPRRFTG
jgi:hypothetical protein